MRETKLITPDFVTVAARGQDREVCKDHPGSGDSFFHRRPWHCPINDHLGAELTRPSLDLARLSRVSSAKDFRSRRFSIFMSPFLGPAPNCVIAVHVHVPAQSTCTL